ncbi:hypothetical protein BRADI_4g31465v3 [Brachypodium distachyon]|uniref:Uncharacterized protein n=1 Tax=Brachypodium distachyon TaxID=15368 RepID=A0A2K2CRN3_BRADI|nr:hypothetical protein BRADI_4g31465v3 [Brachypodium distachyon]
MSWTSSVVKFFLMMCQNQLAKIQKTKKDCDMRLLPPSNLHLVYPQQM